MRFSIQHKILISFSIIIFIGLSSLLFVSYKITEQNTNNTIHEDMIGAKKNLDQYLKQYFLINNMELNQSSLSSESDDISNQLSSQIGNPVDIYDLNGDKLSSKTESQDKNDKSTDLTNAVKGMVSYSFYSSGNKTYVSLSYPIKADGKSVGIIRCTKDYTELFNYSKRFINVINLFAAAIFVIISIVSFILSRQITKPIKKLTEGSEQVSKGNFDINLEVKTKDEIGELSSTFKMMIERIKEQIEIIRDDRDALKESQMKNKVFFDNVTHELKTPITTIMGYSKAIEDNGFNDKRFFDKGISYIKNESLRLNNMVIELLELSKSSSKKFNYNFEIVELSQIIKATCDEMKIKGKKYNIKINYNVEEGLHINGDKDRLKEVIINLIDNSIKYGNVNSIVVVTAYSENSLIIIKVKDQGEGIPEEKIKHLFEPFYRVSKKNHSEIGSAGLGLSIVKEIVEMHGGKIEIKSKINEGTEAAIMFPMEEI